MHRLPTSIDLSPVARLVVRDLAAAPSATVAAVLGERVGAGSDGATIDTPFDLASVTKPFVALTLCRLERAGVLSRREILADLLPHLAGTAAGRVTLDLLAAHRAGVQAHLRLYAPLERGEPFDRDLAIRTAAESLRPEIPLDHPIPEEGFPPVYSDMGYLLLGLAIEARTQAPLDEVVRREITEPLGIADRVGSARQLAALDPTFTERVAPTEDTPYRGGVIRGLVHDDNAFAIGGDTLLGHAGLFGDARSVLDFGRAILAAIHGEDTAWLTAADLEPALRRRPGGSLLAGFDARSGDAPSSGARLGPASFGHLGFTGTSLWIDPEQRFAGALLSNRVHPSRDHIAIRKARPLAYDMMVDLLAEPTAS